MCHIEITNQTSYKLHYLVWYSNIDNWNYMLEWPGISARRRNYSCYNLYSFILDDTLSCYIALRGALRCVMSYFRYIYAYFAFNYCLEVMIHYYFCNYYIISYLACYCLAFSVHKMILNRKFILKNELIHNSDLNQLAVMIVE